MSKHKSLIKKIQKQILSVNDLIESNFNKLKYFKSNYKKILISKDNRLILAIGAVVILTSSLHYIDVRPGRRANRPAPAVLNAMV